MRADPAARRIVYILGSLRSGSTLLESLLGNGPAVASIGESINLYRFYADNLPCSCGRPVRECPVHAEVGRRTGLFARDFDLPAFAREVRSTVRFRRTPRAVLSGRFPDAVVTMHRRVVECFADVTAAHTVIESSKTPALARLLDGTRLGGSEAWTSSYLHLVRDPRAVAFSDSRPPATGDARIRPPRRNVAMSAGMWDVTNVLVDWCRRHPWADRPSTRLRYEDVVADPRGSLQMLSRTLDIPDVLTEGDEVPLRACAVHAIGGNPGRPGQGTRIRADERWMTEMSATERLVSEVLTSRRRRRYGYS